MFFYFLPTIKTKSGGNGGVIGNMLFNITKAKVDNALNSDEQAYLKELRERPAESLTGQEKKDLQWLEERESQEVFNRREFFSSNGINMLSESDHEIIGGVFKYSDGRAIEFLSEISSQGDKLSLTNMAFYPEGATGNENKEANTFRGAKKLC